MTATENKPYTDRVTLPDGGRMAYLEVGSGSPVVLLHGGVLDHRQWTPQLDTLGRSHRVIAVDARGHGWSSTPTGPFRYCDDLAALLQELELGPTALVGISMGAGTAVDVALEYPDLVDRLLVSGAGASDPTFTEPWLVDRMTAWTTAAEAGDKPGWIEVFLSISPGPDRSLDELDPQMVALLRTMAERTVEVHIPDGPPVMPVPVEDPWSRVHEIAVPVLAVPGLADAADHIRMAEELARGVQRGSIESIAGVAHYPNLEKPAEFDEIARQFLAA